MYFDYEYTLDQAGELRRMVLDNNNKNKNKNDINTSKKLHTLSVLSGKGGVGKSNIAASMAFALADFGKRVVLIDADLGMANLDILCGVQNAKYNISHLIDGSRTLNEILVHFKTSAKALNNHGSVSLLPGGFGLSEMADLDDIAMARLLDNLSSLEDSADYLIMDAGAGIHKAVLSFAYASETTLLVTTPEPTSVRAAYGVIKSLGASAWQSAGGMKNGLMLIVNMAQSSREAIEVSERIRLASMQFLGNAPLYLGCVLRDEAVENSVRECKIFYRSEPESRAGICLRNLAGELIRISDGVKNPPHESERITGVMKTFFQRLARTLKVRK